MDMLILVLFSICFSNGVRSHSSQIASKRMAFPSRENKALKSMSLEFPEHSSTKYLHDVAKEHERKARNTQSRFFSDLPTVNKAQPTINISSLRTKYPEEFMSQKRLTTFLQQRDNSKRKSSLNKDVSRKFRNIEKSYPRFPTENLSSKSGPAHNRPTINKRHPFLPSPMAKTKPSSKFQGKGNGEKTGRHSITHWKFMDIPQTMPPIDTSARNPFEPNPTLHVHDPHQSITTLHHNFPPLVDYFEKSHAQGIAPIIIPPKDTKTKRPYKSNSKRIKEQLHSQNASPQKPLLPAPRNSPGYLKTHVSNDFLKYVTQPGTVLIPENSPEHAGSLERFHKPRNYGSYDRSPPPPPPPSGGQYDGSSDTSAPSSYEHSTEDTSKKPSFADTLPSDYRDEIEKNAESYIKSKKSQNATGTNHNSHSVHPPSSSYSSAGPPHYSNSPSSSHSPHTASSYSHTQLPTSHSSHPARPYYHNAPPSRYYKPQPYSYSSPTYLNRPPSSSHPTPTHPTSYSSKSLPHSPHSPSYSYNSPRPVRPHYAPPHASTHSLPPPPNSYTSPPSHYSHDSPPSYSSHYSDSPPPPHSSPNHPPPPYSSHSSQAHPPPPYSSHSSPDHPPPPYSSHSSPDHSPPPYSSHSSSDHPPPPYSSHSSSDHPPPPYSEEEPDLKELEKQAEIESSKKPKKNRIKELILVQNSKNGEWEVSKDSKIPKENVILPPSNKNRYLPRPFLVYRYPQFGMPPRHRVPYISYRSRRASHAIPSTPLPSTNLKWNHHNKSIRFNPDTPSKKKSGRYERSFPQRRRSNIPNYGVERLETQSIASEESAYGKNLESINSYNEDDKNLNNTVNMEPLTSTIFPRAFPQYLQNANLKLKTHIFANHQQPNSYLAQDASAFSNADASEEPFSSNSKTAHDFNDGDEGIQISDENSGFDLNDDDDGSLDNDDSDFKGNYQYVNNPEDGAYEFGYRMGTPEHTVERSHQTSGILSKIKVNWKDAKGNYGEHLFEYNHFDDEEPGFWDELDDDVRKKS